MAFGAELEDVLERLRRAFPRLDEEGKRGFVVEVCRAMSGYVSVLQEGAAAAAEEGEAEGRDECSRLLRRASSGPTLQSGESGEVAAVALLNAVAAKLRRSRKLPRGVVVTDARVERLRPGRNVKKRLDCRLTVSVSIEVEGALLSRVLLLALEAKRTQSVSAASLRAFLEHDVAVRSEPGHHGVLTAFVSWLCDVPKSADYESDGRFLFGAASENAEAVAAVLCHEAEALLRRLASDGAAFDEAAARSRRADYLRDRLEAILRQRAALQEEEALVRELIPGAALAVDKGHAAGVEKRPRAASSSGGRPPWWKRPRVV